MRLSSQGTIWPFIQVFCGCKAGSSFPAGTATASWTIPHAHVCPKLIRTYTLDPVEPHRRGSFVRSWFRVLACLAACALAGAGTTSRASAAAPLTANWYESAPYYLTLDPGAPDLTQVMAATGQRAFELAFILAP